MATIGARCVFGSLVASCTFVGCGSQVLTSVVNIPCSGSDRRRRKTLRAYNVLGDVSEYEATLQAVEKPREPTPPPETFDLSCVPLDILAAMDSDKAVYKPILEAYKEILDERKALADEHARVMALVQSPSTAQPHDLASLEATRDSRYIHDHTL